MTWVPEHQRTTGWYLFNELFLVKINSREARTAEEIKRYGTPSTGHEVYDQEMDKDEDKVMWNIAKIEAHYGSGYAVRIVNPKDCSRIYELVNNHLKWMNNFLCSSENATGDPKTMEELKRLDQFAEEVFRHARYDLRENLQHAGYARAAKKRDPLAGLAALARQRGPAKVPEVKPGQSTVGRQYGTSDSQTFTPPKPDEVLVPDPLIEDPNLPKRVSLANLFEERKQMALKWH